MRKQAQISPPPFFLRLSPVGGSGWKPSTAKVSEVGADPRKQGGECAEAGTNFPTAFFLRLSPIGGSGWKPSPPSGSKIHRADGKIHRRRQNPPPTAKSTADGKIHRRRRCSAVRAAAADGKIHRRRRCSAGRVRGQQQRRRQNPPQAAKIRRRRQNPP